MNVNVLSVRQRNAQHCKQHQRKMSHRFSRNQDIESRYSTQYLTATLAGSSSIPGAAENPLPATRTARRKGSTKGGQRNLVRLCTFVLRGPFPKSTDPILYCSSWSRTVAERKRTARRDHGIAVISR